jgi:retinoid hydroxylase
MTTTLPNTQLPYPPGDRGLRGWIDQIRFLLNPGFIQGRAKKHGNLFTIIFLGTPTVIMIGQEAAKFVLSSGMDHFSWKEGWPVTFKTLLGESLFVQDGEEHRIKRKLIMPAFHRQALSNYTSTMEEIGLRYMAQWEAQGQFDWFTSFKQMTFEIAAKLLLGSEPNEDVAHLSTLFTDLTNGFFTIPVNVPFSPYGKAIRARNEILAYIEKAVLRRQANPQNDALGLLVQSKDEDGNSLSLRELKAQALLLLFAGHETTTSMLSLFCYSVAQHPQALAKLRAEQQALIAVDNGKITLETAKQMPYLEQVLKEVERLYPPVAGGFRGVIKSFDFNGYHIPKGWKVLYNIIGTHQDSAIFSAPDAFDPERFAPENDYPLFSTIGFGGGPRVCVGLAFAQLEMKIIAAHLLRGYQWQVLNPNVEMATQPTMRPKDNLPVRFARLEKA